MCSINTHVEIAIFLTLESQFDISKFVSLSILGFLILWTSLILIIVRLPQLSGNTYKIISHPGTSECFKIIGSAKNDYHLKIKESLNIMREKPELNITVRSFPLYLFWSIYVNSHQTLLYIVHVFILLYFLRIYYVI